MLCLLTALPSEARPLLRHFDLPDTPLPGPFACYVGEQAALVVSGIGKMAAAAACGYLYAQLQHRSEISAAALASAAWINVGIAGHGSLPVGESLLAHEISDQSSGRRHFPPLVFTPPCVTETVITVDDVERLYDPPVAYDMEAAAFYAVASRLTHVELVHCLKVVSDGPEAEPERITRGKVEAWIDSQLATLDALVLACRDLMVELKPLHEELPDFEACIERWHFTVSDRHELRRLLRRRQTLVPDAELPVEELAENVRGKQVNRVLRQWLDALPVSF